jgi:hypothetical protein
MADKYLIVFVALKPVVPEALRDFIAKKITDEFSKLDVELDFKGSKKPRDLTVTFDNEIPALRIFGESTRVRVNSELLSGDSTVYARMIRMMRLQINDTTCEPAFPETEDSLGLMIANVTIHEVGHMLGMDEGGYDGGGHTTDKDNYMWDPGSMPGPVTVLSPFEYTVKPGDTMIGIVHRHTAGTLDTCRIGPTGLTYRDVWGFPENKKMGFVAHPTKGGVRGRRVNDPNWIYPGEKVALPCNNLRTQAYRHYFEGSLGKKTFTKDQIETMQKFIAARLAAGKG